MTPFQTAMSFAGTVCVLYVVVVTIKNTVTALRRRPLSQVYREARDAHLEQLREPETVVPEDVHVAFPERDEASPARPRLTVIQGGYSETPTPR